MHRFVLLAGALLAGSSAYAQSQDIQPAPAPIYAGTYHVAAGVFMPANGGDAFFAASPGVIYNNTCTVGAFFSTLNGTTAIDEGRIPSATSPAPNVGSINNYTVNSLDFVYCTKDLAGVINVDLLFWQNYDDCQTLALAGPPTASYNLTGLPGSTTTGVTACFIITVNLTGVTFDILGDADGAYTTGSNLDEGFGYGIRLNGQTGTTNAQVGGVFLAGDVTPPGACANGNGTYYKLPGVSSGTGLDNDDLYRRDGAGGQTSGCIFFGGPPNPHAGFHLLLRADDVADCNGNDIADNDDIANLTSADLNANSIPDECEPDCNGNSIPDDLDISSATSLDCDSNAVPDECQTDCNANSIPDTCDLTSATSLDCNGNSIPDECDIASGFSTDINANGIPDSCEFGNGIPYCFGTGFGVTCRCGNTDGAGAGCRNSLGVGAKLYHIGGTSVGADDCELAADRMPSTNLCIIFMGDTQIEVLLGDGLKCAGGIIKRFPAADTSGTGTFLQTQPAFWSNGLITAGTTWNFQAWFRDGGGPCAFGTNLSNAMQITFTP